jgi:hypothetical protein
MFIFPIFIIPFSEFKWRSYTLRPVIWHSKKPRRIENNYSLSCFTLQDVTILNKNYQGFVPLDRNNQTRIRDYSYGSGPCT